MNFIKLNSQLLFSCALFGLSSSVLAQACPSADINSVLSDPVVDAAMDTAWANSQEGSASEHEEGFYFYQCRTQTESVFSYVTEVDFGVGTVSSLTLPARRTDPSCRLIGDFHTHPGVAVNDPASNDPYQNDQPSPQDLSSGIPGAITYGLGLTRGPGQTTDVTYGPTVNPNLSWTCADAQANVPTPTPASYNDPHLITLDGIGYDFQAVGEFTLAKSELGGLLIQSRQQPTGGAGSQVSMNTAFAFAVGEDNVAVQFDQSQNLLVLVNQEQQFEQGELILTGGGRLLVDMRDISIVWPDQSIAKIRVRTGFLNLSLGLADRHIGKITGLLGNFDGDQSNDLQTVNGDTLSSPPSANEIYGDFANGWRISDDTTLFVYFGEENTSSFTDILYPGRIVRVSDLDSSALSFATSICETRGIINSLMLSNCIIDVGISSNVEFAEATGELENELAADVVALEVQGQIDLADQSCANPALVDAGGVLVPDLAGRYRGSLTNPDSGTNWDTIVDLQQCGVDVNGLIQITVLGAASGEQYRRFVGQWADAQLLVQLDFPFTYSSLATGSPCRNMAASLSAIENVLQGFWTADNCPLGGEISVVRE